MTFPSSRSLGLVATLLLACGMAADATAQTTLTTELVASGFSNALEARSLPGDDRIFVVEQNQADIHIIDASGAVLPTPFLDLTGKVQTGGERGLLGLAFHPDYETNGYFYVNYTRGNPNRTIVERYSVSTTNPNVADASSGFQILSFPQPQSNHNGGCLRFGPDGYLYIGTGDGGGAGDSSCNAQNPGTYLGKMLRIDVDGGSPYAVPATNPYVSTPGFLPEIWGVGLRNPWRYGFDPLTGELFIGDVGQSSREEVNVVPASDGPFNFGWKMMEGTTCFGTGGCPGGILPCNNAALTDPVTEYPHTGPFGGPCSITGGEVMRDCSIPGLFGTYFYADYCSAQIFSFDYTGGVVSGLVERTGELAPGGGLSINTITSFGVDGDGAVLIVDGAGNGNGEVYRIVAASQPTFADCDGNGKEDGCEILLDPSLDLDGDGVLDSCSTCGYSTYGVGASPVNLLTLSGAGTGAIGTSAQFVTSAAPTGAQAAFVFVSLGQANVPAVGGVGLVNLNLVIQTLLAPIFSGTGTATAPIPNAPAFVGLSVYVQSAVPDGTQPLGWVLSNGLKLDICP